MPVIHGRKNALKVLERARERNVPIPIFGTGSFWNIEAILIAAKNIREKYQIAEMPVTVSMTYTYPCMAQAKRITVSAVPELGFRSIMTQLRTLVASPESPYKDIVVLPHLDHADPERDRWALTEGTQYLASAMFDAQRFPAERNAELTAEYVKAYGGEILVDNPAESGARRRIAVICHGQTANRYAALKYADIFYRAGFSVLIYDERYFGESGGECCTLGQEESKDLAEILAFARRRFGEDCLIALHGESMGAATALLVLRYAGVDLIAADCPFADSELLFRQWLGKNLPIPPGLIMPYFEFVARRRFDYHVRETSPIAAVRGADVPILFMHGRDDTLIPCSHSEELLRACRDGRSELHLFDGADHAQSIVSDRARYEALLLAFLKKSGAIE